MLYCRGGGRVRRAKDDDGPAVSRVHLSVHLKNGHDDDDVDDTDREEKNQLDESSSSSFFLFPLCNNTGYFLDFIFDAGRLPAPCCVTRRTTRTETTTRAHTHNNKRKKKGKRKRGRQLED